MVARRVEGPEHSPPTPGIDDTPYIRFAIDQLTRDEETLGPRGTGVGAEAFYPNDATNSGVPHSDSVYSEEKDMSQGQERRSTDTVIRHQHTHRTSPNLLIITWILIALQLLTSSSQPILQMATATLSLASFRSAYASFRLDC